MNTPKQTSAKTYANINEKHNRLVEVTPDIFNYQNLKERIQKKKEYKMTNSKQQRRKITFLGLHEAICPKCQGEGIRPSAATTFKEACGYCLGRGIVDCFPNKQIT